MLDEMFQQNASKFAIFLEYENLHAYYFSLSTQTRAFIRGKNKVACNEKQTKKYVGFHIPFRWNISSSINLYF